MSLLQQNPPLTAHNNRWRSVNFSTPANEEEEEEEEEEEVAEKDEGCARERVRNNGWMADVGERARERDAWGLGEESSNGGEAVVRSRPESLIDIWGRRGGAAVSGSYARNVDRNVVRGEEEKEEEEEEMEGEGEREEDEQCEYEDVEDEEEADEEGESEDEHLQVHQHHHGFRGVVPQHPQHPQQQRQPMQQTPLLPSPFNGRTANPYFSRARPQVDVNRQEFVRLMLEDDDNDVELPPLLLDSDSEDDGWM